MEIQKLHVIIMGPWSGKMQVEGKDAGRYEASQGLRAWNLHPDLNQLESFLNSATAPLTSGMNIYHTFATW